MKGHLRAAATNPLLLLLAAVLVLVGMAGRNPSSTDLDAERIAIPVPLPIYEIEGTYAGQPLQLLNLPLAPIGVVPLPIPVDLNRDLIPDVTVAVNILNVAGLFENPPNLLNVLAPNVEVNRLLPGLPLTAIESSLRINVKLTLLDLQGQPPTILRLGYGTGAGGSVPAKFKVTAAGLASFFDPLTASVEAPGYEGPLSLIAGFEQGPQRADADLRFQPLPAGLRFTYGSTDGGQLIRASHGGAPGAAVPADREVDLDADIRVRDGADLATVKARVDRLPSTVDVIIAPGAEGAGGFTYQASTDGRLPDVRVDATTTAPGEPPLTARLDLEALPPRVEAAWSLAEDEPAAVRVAAPDRPIGAVEARVANFLGTTDLPGYVPTAPQYVDLRQAADEGEGDDEVPGDRLVTARVEGVRLVEFEETAGGIDSRFASAGGGRPLELHAAMAEVGESERQLVATSTVSPLPRELRATVSDASDDDQPIVVRYEASDSVDVDGHLEVRDADVVATAACGQPGTICADLDVRDIPTSIETRIEQLDAGDDPDEVRVAVDAIPRDGGSPPDVFADVTFGQDDGVPFVAHAEALAIPEHLRVRAVDGADQTTARAEFHACDRDYDAEDGAGACLVDTEGQVGALAFSLRNFLGERPAGLPILVADEPNRATVAARGRAGDPDVVDFEASGRVAAVRELRYIDEDVFGLRTAVGGGGGLRAIVDIAGVDLGGDGLSDLRAEAFVPDVPDSLDLCFRGSSSPVAAEPVDPVTAPCENRNPFGPGVPTNPADAPISVAYRASDTIDATTSIDLIDHGPTSSVGDDRTIDAVLDIDNLPAEATAHVLAPETGPVRALYDTGDPVPGASAPTRLHFEGAIADADLACRDPRQPAFGDQVFCIEGTIVGLPNQATFEYDDARATDNLVVHTSNTIDIEGLGLSLVEGVDVDDDEDDFELGTEALVVSGAIDDIPTDLKVTLQTPEVGPTAVRLTADPPIGGVEATVQNFVGADPLPSGPPAQRAGLPPVDPSTYDTVTLLQLGDLFRAAVDVTQLARAGYASYVSGEDEDEDDVSTHAVDLGFGDDRNVRAYVDVDDGESHAIADVTLEDRPAGMSMCFRGARAEAAALPPGFTPTFCDTSAATDGAVELQSEPHAANESLDVNAFFRVVDELAGETISGYADVDDLPPFLRTELGGAADAEVKAVDAANAPVGVGRLAFHVASFDIADHGYAFPPFVFDPRGEPFPAPAASGQHIGAVVTDTDFDVRGLIGPPTPGAPGSRLERLRLAPDACRAPEGTDDQYPNYPAVPEGAESPYTCAEVEFEPVGGSPDPLAVGLTIAKDTRRIVVRDAELSDIPESLRLTLADLPATAGDDPSTPRDESTFLPRCATAGADVPATGSCVPPMLRVDADAGGAQPILRAIVELGSRSAIDELGNIVTPADDLPDLGATPTAAGWSDWGGDPRGVRLTLARDAGTADELSIRAGLRIPLPQTLSVHPFQSWDDENTNDGAGDPDDDDPTNDTQSWSAMDAGFGYEATFADPAIQSLGRIAALLRMDDGAQIVATDGQEIPTYATRPDGPPVLREPVLGIPRELDVAFYRRDNKLLGRELIQVDGRVNAPMDLRVRLFPPLPTEPDEAPGVPVDAHLINLPGEQSANQTDPSFRVRAELIKPKKPLGTPAPDTSERCDDYINNDVCESEIVVASITASLNFDPSPDHEPVRLLNAVARFDDQTGFQVHAYDNIDGDDLGDPNTVVSGEVGIELNPLNIEWAMSAVLGVDAEVASILEAYVTLDKVSDFALRQNAMRLSGVNTSHGLGEGQGYVTPIMRLEDFDVSVILDLYFFDFDIFGSHYIDFSDIEDAEPISIEFDECGAGQLLDGPIDLLKAVGLPLAKLAEELITGDFEYFIPRSLEFPADGETVDVIAVPDGGDPRMVLEIAEIPVLPFGGSIITGLFDGLVCFGVGESTIPLIDEDLGFPGDSLFEYTGHPVPETDASDAEPDVVIGGDDLDLVVDGLTQLCGDHRYRNVTVEGNLLVANLANDTCPAGSEGSLHLRADQITVQPGALVAVPAGAHGGMALSADNITVDGDVLSLQGPIALNADDTLSVAGSIHADNTNETMPVGPDGEPLGDPARFTGGGGHGGAGGNGYGGFGDNGGEEYGEDGGDPFPDNVTNSPLVDGGAPGAGTNPGLGGGSISLAGNTLIISGPVTANGGDGGGPDSCSSSGLTGGGGAGGGISLVAADLFLAPNLIAANGGDGSASQSGSSGGGGAGIIKVLAPRTNGSPLPAAPQGGEGGDDCGLGPLFRDGGHQDLVTDLGPQSTFESFRGVWQTEDVDPQTPDPALEGIFSAANVATGADDFNVVACAAYLGPEVALQDNDDEPGPDGPPDASRFAMLMPHPSTVNVSFPCGQTMQLPPGCAFNTPTPCTGFSVGARRIGTAYVEDSNEIRYDIEDPASGGRVGLTNLEEGYFAAWTMVVNTTVDGNDCYQDNPNHCIVDELQPPVPDTVFGIDNTDARITEALVEESEGVVRQAATSQRWFTRNEEIAFTIEASDLPDTPGAVPLSGVAGVECVEINVAGDRAPFDCTVGRNVHRFLLPGDGHRRIEITVVDGAGNRNRLPGTTNFPTDIGVTIDRTAPIGSPGLFGPHADITPSVPDGENGWYRTAPSIDLLTAIDTDNSDGTQGSGPPANTPGANEPAWRYRFDSGEEQTCVDEPDEVQAHTADGCHIADALPSGTHVLHFTAVDRLDNRLPAEAPEDDPDAQVMFASDPISIDGTPPTSKAILVPLDADGENGWYRTAPFVVLSAVDEPGGSGLVTEAGQNPVAGLYYRLNGASEQRFTAPFRLEPGPNQVCWRAIDVAGNADVGVLGVEPSVAQLAAAGHCMSAQVDTADPVVSLTVSPSAPTGGDGWYLTPPTVTASATDPAPGSGIDPFELKVSFDGAPFSAYGGPMTIPEGVHQVRAFVTDGAGRASDVVEVTLRVDQSTPVARARLAPPTPARGTWYRRLPTLVLRATDGEANAGVARLEYRIDGGAFQPYTDPVAVPAGVHTIGYRAVDRAGRASAITNLPVSIDDGAPLAQALSPAPVLWSRLLGPPTANLNWVVGDDRAGTVRITVLITDLFGNVIRRIDGGTRTVTAGGTASGFTAWDGRDGAGSNLTIGVYHYRLVVTDAAGNRAQSNASRPIQIKLL